MPRAFTLVELLVVIGIIAVLVSILLPAINGARRQAKLVQCSAIIRSLLQGAQTHVQSHRGYLPLAGHLVVDPGTPAWDFAAGVNDRSRTRYSYADCPNYTMTRTVVPLPAAMAEHFGVNNLPTDIDGMDSALNSKQGVWRHFVCPDSTADLFNPTHDDGIGQGMMLVAALGPSDAVYWSTNSDYGFNEGVLGFHYDGRYARNRLAGRLSGVRHPSEVALFTDALPRKAAVSPNMPYGWICWTPALDASAAVTLGDALTNGAFAMGADSFDLKRHGKRINVGFVDGHVESFMIEKGDLDRVYLIPP